MKPSTQIIASRSAASLIDTIHCYEDDGYHIDELWYECGWIRCTYYAKMVRKPPDPPDPPAKPYIEFTIGPITNRNFLRRS